MLIRSSGDYGGHGAFTDYFFEDKAQKDTQPIRVISSRSQIIFFLLFQLGPQHINIFSIRSFYYFKLTKWLSMHFKIL